MPETQNEFAAFLPTLDRSELEIWGECPMQARLLEDRKRVVGDAAHIGEEGHKPIGRTIANYIAAGGNWGRKEILDELQTNLMDARPDVQSRVWEAFSRSVWAIADCLAPLHPDAILKHDGGEGKRSGQIATEVCQLQFTSELDLLHATPSKAVLRECDWKSGWGFWDIDRVYHSFQFQSHAVLVFDNFPDCEVLEVAVLNNRIGKFIRTVEFERKDMLRFVANIAGRSVNHAKYSRQPVETVPAWPTEERCAICPCTHRCPMAEAEFAEAPEVQVDQLVVTEARVKALKKRLTAVRKERGEAIVSPNGNKYGHKPQSKFVDTCWSEKGGDEE